MSKTRRKKINHRPKSVFGNSNIQVAVVQRGDLVQPKNSKKNIFTGRQYTGINTGKVYPYASTKRGGGPTP